MVMAGFFIGKWIGQNLGFEDLGAVTGVLIGFFAWVLRLWFLLKPTK